MDEKSTIAMLEQKLGTDTNKSYGELGTALDNLPLAISQAAAYIRDRQPRESIASYLKQLEHSWKCRTTLLQSDEHFPDRGHDASSSILLTLQSSFHQLQKLRPSAASLLALMIFCNRQFIPEMLIKQTQPGIDASDNLENDIVALQKFSFISATHEEQSWTMHRLVQDAARLWMQNRNKLVTTQAGLLHNLHGMSGQSCACTKQLTCQMLLPHVSMAVMRRPPDSGDPLRLANDMARDAGWYICELGTGGAGLAVGLEARRAVPNTSGDKDIFALSSNNQLVRRREHYQQDSKVGITGSSSAKHNTLQSKACLGDRSVDVSNFAAVCRLKVSWQRRSSWGLRHWQYRKQVLVHKGQRDHAVSVLRQKLVVYRKKRRRREGYNSNPCAQGTSTGNP
ncbi:hypothetical protein Slin15195_G063940 [Septoria linicola]|uniref:DUF7779 domain-containing protein n=1 Tax=Septoria linicola TaxID=215465 RepID=A0A9Q9AQ78_9PEZI|nr:hypothetical protein Slin14017_G114260 [Septoria linicola]USW53075.1 hypothetical protein Slin15195_G063940 [Septoria linicola]